MVQTFAQTLAPIPTGAEGFLEVTKIISKYTIVARGFLQWGLESDAI